MSGVSSVRDPLQGKHYNYYKITILTQPTRLEKHLNNRDTMILPVPTNNLRPTEFMMKIAVTGVANTRFSDQGGLIVTLKELNGKNPEWKNKKRPML